MLHAMLNRAPYDLGHVAGLHQEYPRPMAEERAPVCGWVGPRDLVAVQVKRLHPPRTRESRPSFPPKSDPSVTTHWGRWKWVWVLVTQVLRPAGHVARLDDVHDVSDLRHE